MTDVHVAPRIKCDNCGFQTDKQASTSTNGVPGDWRPPNGWGNAFVGGLFAGEEVSFSDLCPTCVTDAAHALRQHFQYSR